jgi:hypothetical protein
MFISFRSLRVSATRLKPLTFDGEAPPAIDRGESSERSRKCVEAKVI